MDQQGKWKYLLLSIALIFMVISASVYFVAASHSASSRQPLTTFLNAGNLSPTAGGTTLPGGGTPTGQPTSVPTVVVISPTPTYCLILNCNLPGGVTPTPPPGPTPRPTPPPGPTPTPPPGPTPPPTPPPTPCTLQAPSAATETFSGEAGSNPTSKTFAIGVIGTCTGNVTITPTASTTSGGAWLTFSPASAVVASGATATFTVSVATAGLMVGTYQGALSLAALDGGSSITGSPQSVTVGLKILAPPVLAVSPSALTFTQPTGSSTQSIKITNTGGAPLNWTTALASSALAYVTISSGASGTLDAGATRNVKITVDTTSLMGGTTTTTGVTISATDAATGAVVAGSPANVSITITPPPPAMQLSATTLNFATTAGTNPAPQSITLTNSGGNGLNWTVGTPSQTWLAVTPPSGSDAAGASTTLTFTVNVTGLLPGTYSATVTITPTTGGGAAQTVTVNLTVS